MEAKGFQGLPVGVAGEAGGTAILDERGLRSKAGDQQNVVVYYKKNLPEKRDEPWFLATSLMGTPTQIVQLYARRMGIEECFRDKKNVNNGWGLRHMRLHTARALDRLLLILAIAYLILCGLGLLALSGCANRGNGVQITAPASAACSPSDAACSIYCKSPSNKSLPRLGYVRKCSLPRGDESGPVYLHRHLSAS